MSEPKSEQPLHELVGVANTAVKQQQEKTAALASAAGKPSAVRQIAIALLLAVLAVVAYVQYPQINEPFGSLDPKENDAVARADLIVIAMEIENYRMSQGKYPTALDQVRLPDELAAFITQQKIGYHPTDTAYTLEWDLPRKRASYDGATGAVKVDVQG